jgi:hypothetical protein
MSFRIMILFALGVFILVGCAAATPAEPAEDKGIEATQPPTHNTDTPAPVTDTPSPATDTPAALQPSDTVAAGEGERSPLDPLPNESKLVRGNVFIEESGVILMESFPVQAALLVSGSLPTPCHELRAKVSEPDKDNHIYIELFSLTDPNMACIQVLERFETSIPLGDYSGGSYTVFLNGEEVGEISL